MTTAEQTSVPQTTQTTQTKPDLDLHLNIGEVKQELALTEPQESSDDPELERKAEEFANILINLDGSGLADEDQATTAVEDMGRHLQREAARRSAMLKQPIKDLAGTSEDGGPVAKALIDLKIKVEELDPNRFDFSPGWLSRILGFIPGIGTPIKRYFTKFESAQTVIDAIIRSLETGRDQLNRDNVTLGEDQKLMRELTKKLDRQIALAQLLDRKIQYKLEREIGPDDPRRKFVEEDLLFALRQRIIDLQQQLAVNQQGVLSTAIIVGNNKELMRGVDRALDVTVSALQVAVTVALALAHQKIVLDKISSLNRTTSDLIAGTAQQLRTQGTEIHAMAARESLDLESLKSAFTDITAAMDEIARFRREALPQMAQTILEFDQLAEKGEEAISRWEEGERARPAIEIEAV